MMVYINLIPPTLLDFVWDEVEPLLTKVIDLAPDELTIESVRDRLYKGLDTLIIITEDNKIIALNTLQVRTLDSGKNVLYIPITSGERMEEWLDTFLEIAEQIARSSNCESLRGISCRGNTKGDAWVRRLNKGKTNNKWKHVQSVIEYDLPLKED